MSFYEESTVESRFKPRNAIFFGVILIFAPIWLSFLIIMICWDVADNFRRQINKGYNKLI